MIETIHFEEDVEEVIPEKIKINKKNSDRNDFDRAILAWKLV